MLTYTIFKIKERENYIEQMLKFQNINKRIILTIVLLINLNTTL